jgi:hypothetical protein
VGGGDQRFGVGTVARIRDAAPFDDGRWALLAEGGPRVTVARWLPDDPYPVAEVTDRPGGTDPGQEQLWSRAVAAVRRVRTLMSELGGQAPVVADPPAGTGGADRVWRLCQMAPVTALDGQKLLEIDDASGRLTLLTEVCEALAGDLSLLLGAGPGGSGS